MTGVIPVLLCIVQRVSIASAPFKASSSAKLRPSSKPNLWHGLGHWVQACVLSFLRLAPPSPLLWALSSVPQQEPSPERERE
ncbi:uncharacterized protein VTP21DRAFT_4846 [Calcarisporiella thermophila]|uniref:uncharacterized protein n=1 Tax=Calcarisporiella thermophila TaxID=911321 RepID=UPI00374424D6